MLRKLTLTVFALTGLMVTLPAAAIAPIVSQADAAEADQIVVTLHQGSGNAVALGCTKCPLRANIDANTKFFLRGKPLTLKQASGLSGETGTMVYSGNKVLKILWDTGHLE